MNRIILILITAITMMWIAGCKEKKEIEPSETGTRQTLLIYAVASSNLSTYLLTDIEEMIAAAPAINGLGKNMRVLLYSVASKTATEATLSELTETTIGEWGFQQLKSYDRDTFSTDPARMSEVFADLRIIAPSELYGLILWSHATGWFPDFSEHQISPSTSPQKSFGWDTYQGLVDKCDIIELVDALPDRMFDYIWFDACYMMGIETVYQMRSKCDYIIGYPTEDWMSGMNYDETLPLLVRPNPDIRGAAKAFFDYYNDQNYPVTVSVISTSKLEKLAGAAAEIYARGERPANTYGIQDYGRSPYKGLYDFGQFTRRYIDEGDADGSKLIAAFDNALSEALVYGGCSTKNFNGTAGAFNPDEFSGLSCHQPNTATAAQEQYYQSFDWVQATKP